MVTAAAVNEFPFLIFLIQLLLIYIVTLKSNLDGGFYKEKNSFFFVDGFASLYCSLFFVRALSLKEG